MNIEDKIETNTEKLETYSEFKRKYYIYRVDDIREYIRKENAEFIQLCEQNEKLFEELKQTLNPKQKSMLEKYSDNCMDLVNVEIDELTKYILKDFEEDR